MWFAFTTAIASNLVARILLALGVSFITYSGFDVLLQGVFMHTQLLLTQSGVSYITLCFMGRMGIDQFINIIISAYTARLALTSLRRMVLK